MGTLLGSLLLLALIVWVRRGPRLRAMEDALTDLAERVAALEALQATAPELASQPAVAFEDQTQPAPQHTALPLPPPAVERRMPGDLGTATPSDAPVGSPGAGHSHPVPSQPAPIDQIADDETPHVTRDRDALESRIGTRWLLYVGLAAIVIGVSYFEKLAIDNHWVSETWRVIQGGIVGLALAGIGLRIAKKGYRLYGQLLAGAGIAVLYVSAYASFNFYHLISHATAFGLMVAITGLGAWLAGRERSEGLALVAVTGGFATPFLLPASADPGPALFAYDALLITGTIALSRWRDWPALTVVSYLFTGLTVLAWAGRFYAPSKYISTELFLTLFCAQFLAALFVSRRSLHRRARLWRAILWTAPLGYYLLSLINLDGHDAGLLLFFVVISLAGVAAGSRTSAWIRLLAWGAVTGPLLAWSAEAGRPWLTAGLSAWAGIYLLHLIGLIDGVCRDDGAFETPDVMLLHANPLIAYFGAYLLIAPVRSTVCGPLAAGFALANLGFAYSLRGRYRAVALHFTALAASLAVVAIALQFDGPWITAGWAAEGVVLTALALRERREWLRAGALALFGAAIARVLISLTQAPAVGELVLLNGRGMAGLFVSGLTFVLAYLHHRDGHGQARRLEVSTGLVAGTLLLWAVALGEIVSYWALHVPPPFERGAQLIAASICTGVFICWLGLSRKEEWVRAIGGALLTVAAYWLFSIQLRQAPSGYVVLLNARAAAGLLAVAAGGALVVLHRRAGGHLVQLPVTLAVLTTGTSLMALSFLTSEIDAFWAARGAANVWSVAREGLQSMAWAGAGAFLIWYGLSAQRLWGRALGALLLLVGAVRLARLHLAAPPAAYVVLANPRLITSLVVIAMLYGLALLYDKSATIGSGALSRVEGRHAAASAVLRLLASALTLTMLTGEISAYWGVFDFRRVAHSASADMHFAREMTLSVSWALYATILVVVGLIRKYAPIRYFAIAVFAVTIVKVFAIDLAELDRIYRVVSIIGLGVALLVTSYLYQRLNSQGKPPREE